MEFYRISNINSILDRKSLFLLGPRSVGKSFLLRKTVTATRTYNLLETKTFRRLTSNPGLIYEECTGPKEIIIIDEVQKIPDLLNEVHRTIEEKSARFVLTGSSARKLKRSHANLLGGRASFSYLLPLTSHEIPDFDLLKYINHGGIPRHYLSADKHIESELEDYVALYLKEEVKDEALTRNLEAFARFLEIMALHSGDELNIDAFSSDCQIKASTFRNYLEVLKDTLIGFEVAPFTQTKKRKAITRSKFFLFDVGVRNYLAHSFPIKPKSSLFGKAFEHFIALELFAYLTYSHNHVDAIGYWRSTSQFEVDFTIGNKVAIEVKSSSLVNERDLRGLKALAEENIFKKLIIVSQDESLRIKDEITIYPWRLFLRDLWDDKII